MTIINCNGTGREINQECNHPIVGHYQSCQVNEKTFLFLCSLSACEKKSRDLITLSDFKDTL